jgi:DNA-binding protein H-NS
MTAGPKGSKSAPKYANPADPSQTWTGRGRKPNWLIEALNEGKSLEDMAL